MDFDNAPQEWAGCLGEMMAWPWRRNPNTRSLAAIWVYYSTGWRQLSSVWGGKVWENEKNFLEAAGEVERSGWGGRTEQKQFDIELSQFLRLSYEFVPREKNSKLSYYRHSYYKPLTILLSPPLTFGQPFPHLPFLEIPQSPHPFYRVNTSVNFSACFLYTNPTFCQLFPIFT